MSSEDIIDMKRSGRAVIVDVRSPDEIVTLANAVEGSINITYSVSTPNLPGPEDFLQNVLNSNLPEDKSTPIITYWNKGGRAGRAKEALESLGYTNVVNGINPANINAAN